MPGTGRTVWIARGRRLFLAIPVDRVWRSSLGQFRTSAETSGVAGPVPVRWTTPDNYHLTVTFIGYVDSADIPSLFIRLRHASSGFRRFELTFAGMEIATADEPKMIWARFYPSEEFGRLAGKCRDTAAEFLRDTYGRTFENGHKNIPHITVARMRGIIRRAGGISAEPHMPMTLTVSAVRLYESVPGPTGSVFTSLGAVRFLP